MTSIELENEPAQSNNGSVDLMAKSTNESDFHCIELEELSKLVAASSSNSQNPFILDEENAQEFLDYLKIANPEETGEVPILKTENKQQSIITVFQIQCANCDTIFNLESFAEHICDYGEDKTLIKTETVETSKEPPEPQTITDADNLNEPQCMAILRENNLKLKKIFKELFKVGGTKGESNKLSGPHACTMCDRKFVHASGLSRHLEKHEQDQLPAIKDTQTNVLSVNVVAKCVVCYRIFNTVQDAMEHWQEDHEIASQTYVEHDMSEDEDIYLMETMIAANHDLNQGEQHTEESSPTMEYGPFKAVILNALLQCEFCDFIFSDMTALFNHEAYHDPARGFECIKCSIYVSTLREIVIHWQSECTFTTVDQSSNINLRRYFACNVCSTKYQSLVELYEHRYDKLHFFPRKHHQSGTIQVNCEKCGSLHTTAESFIIHYDQFHVKKTKKDNMSSATTSTKYRQYLCDVCGKSYTQSSHLWQHLRFHKGVKPFACQEPNCTRRFTIRPDLNDHIRKCHTGERPYHCLICGKRFLTGSVFYQHRLIHRGERRYGCDECGKRFYRADALKNHQRIHTGEKPYACSHCTKNFRQRGDRDKHLRARHGTAPFMLNPNINYSGPVRNDVRLRETAELRKKKECNDVLYLGNIPFPRSMFQPILKDIDANARN